LGEKPVTSYSGADFIWKKKRALADVGREGNGNQSTWGLQRKADLRQSTKKGIGKMGRKKEIPEGFQEKRKTTKKVLKGVGKDAGRSQATTTAW